MTTKFSAFTAASAPASGDLVVGLQGGANVKYTMAQLAALFGSAKFFQTFGDGSSVSYVINHALGTRDVDVTVYRTAAPFDEVIVDVQHTDVNNVTLIFATAPAVNQFRVRIST